MKNLLNKLQIEEEIANQILNKYNDDIAKVNEDLQTANKNLELKDTQLTEVQKNIKELQKLEPEKVREELENTKTKMKELEQAHKLEIDNIKIDNAINTSLMKNGAINNKAVIPFINKGVVKFDENGNIVGLDDQLKELIKGEETSFLFKQKEQVNIKGLEIQTKENATPGNSIGKPINNNYISNNKFQLGKIPSFEMFEKQFNNQ